MSALSDNPTDMSLAVAVMRLPHDDPPMATVAPRAVHNDSSSRSDQVWTLEAVSVENIVADAVSTEFRTERTPEVREPVRASLSGDQPALHHGDAWHRIAHALAAEIMSLVGDPKVPSDANEAPLLSEAESRVMRFLPTNLSQREIAGELYLSVNTVKTHIEHIYAKLDVHNRKEAVERARCLGLLASQRRAVQTRR